jgi:hypothetical protein
MFDRGGLVTSQAFDITRNDITFNLFVKILRAYPGMRAKELGYNPSYQTKFGDVYIPGRRTDMEPFYVTVAKHRFEIHHELFYSSEIASRGILCWLAKDEESRPCVVKDAWRSVLSGSEGDLYKEAESNHVWGLADCRFYEDVTVEGKDDVCSNVRKGLTIDYAKKYNLQVPQDYGSSPGPASQSHFNQKRSGGNPPEGTRPDKGAPNAKPVEPTEEQVRQWNRVHTRSVCYTIGRTIEKFRSIQELLEALQDAIKGKFSFNRSKTIWVANLG